MSIVRFIGDIHVGKRLAHSTKESNERYQKFKYDLIADSMKDADVIVQMGDLFDGFTCNNNDFVQAAYIAVRSDLVIGGNHDFSHDTTHRSALQDLKEIVQCLIVDDGAISIEVDGTRIWAIPYQPTQKLFLQACADICQEIDTSDTNILCLHANYDNELSTAEIENNITPDIAELLKGCFDYIVNGHEHRYKAIGPIIMTGAVVPMSFGEMEDKVCMDYDTESTCMTEVCIWEASDHYQKLDVQDFLELRVLRKDVQFIEITGEIKPGEILPVSKKMTELFKLDHVFAIRNNSHMLKEEGLAVDQDFKQVDWIEMVESQLTPGQLELFRVYK